MGQHDLPDRVLLDKAAAGAERITGHLSSSAAKRADQSREGDLDCLDKAIRSLNQLTELLKKESASQ